VRVLAGGGMKKKGQTGVFQILRGKSLSFRVRHILILNTGVNRTFIPRHIGCTSVGGVWEDKTKHLSRYLIS
jgi:hypothetical protein